MYIYNTNPLTMKHYLSLLCLVILSVSCERRECKSSNPVFNNNKPTSEVYKAELAKELKENTEELDYHLAEYHETDTFPYMIVNVQGGDICARAVVTIEKHDEDIAGIVKNKGTGYRGARLAGLKIAIVQQPGTTQFYYNGVDYIAD